MSTEEVTKYESSAPFVLFDRLDDALIVQELEGRLPEVLTYHFKQDGQEVWGLSKSGIDECSNELGKKGEVIRELSCEMIEHDTDALFTVKAGRYVVAKDGKEILLDTKMGFKRQSKLTKKGNVNQFWYEQGAIKACRNAASRLIPASIKTAVIEYAKSKGKVKDVGLSDFEEAVPIQEPPKETPTAPNFKFLKTMEAQKKRVGETAYYEALKMLGFSHANEIVLRDAQVAAYNALKACPDKVEEK